MMLTARGDDVDRIVGLEMGADDYLPKPFNPRELVARIRAIKRRVESVTMKTASEYDIMTAGEVELDPGTHTVVCAGQQVILTGAEFALLAVLLRSAGRVVSRETICEEVLGRPFSPFDRSVDVHVSNLRKKLGRHPDGRERIKTVRGVGYLFIAR